MSACESCRTKPGTVLWHGFVVCGGCALEEMGEPWWTERDYDWDDLARYEPRGGA